MYSGIPIPPVSNSGSNQDREPYFHYSATFCIIVYDHTTSVVLHYLFYKSKPYSGGIPPGVIPWRDPMTETGSVIPDANRDHVIIPDNFYIYPWLSAGFNCPAGIIQKIDESP